MSHRSTIFFLTCLTIIGFSWGFYQCAQVDKAARIIENDASRSFYELMAAADELSVLTAKAAVAKDSDTRADLYAEIGRKAYVAQENLCMLPVYNNTLSDTEHLLNQTGDYAAVLVKKAARAEEADSEEATTVRRLNRNMNEMAKSLHELEKKDVKAFSYQAIKTASKNIHNNDYKNGSALASLADISETASKSPSLIYDGPYSDHLENKGPVKIDGERISRRDAKKKAKALLGDEYVYSFYGKSSKAAGIAVYTVAVRKQDDGEPFAYLDFSVNGGYPVQYTAASEAEADAFKADKALAIAADFLKKAGYDGLQPGYHLTNNHILTANFTAMLGDVIVYPDMIKVSVDLSNGKVVGLDAKNYLEFHRERKLPQLILTPAAAAEQLPAGVTPVSTRKAIIPKADQSEVYCYEFRFRENDNDYLIYINAESGKEEDILIVKDGPSGTFTM